MKYLLMAITLLLTACDDGVRAYKCINGAVYAEISENTWIVSKKYATRPCTDGSGK